MKELLFEKTEYQKVTSGYVYVVKVDGRYKIGKTKNPTNRFGEYTRLYEEPIVVVCEVVFDYSEVEKELHKKYADKRLRGEWFNLNETDIELIKNYLKERTDEKYNIEKEVKIYVPADYETVKISNTNYIKEFEKTNELLDLLRDYPSTFYAINIMKHYLVKDFNILVKNGKKFSAITLARQMDISRQASSSYFKKLKELNIIKSVKVDKYGVVFAVNPNYYLNGTSVPKEIYDLFDIENGGDKE